ncbi:hypothetical protein POM88_015004 [Heracleum sosnowskyi]|uniref:Uncharacterized protein n=1 Tax=Heracleum sosnowskyi TaxID=360622 RepID=A0AAD8IJQ7_9APIA|nr:hypothetical protein POM88_015004 [Heracleum sosnowskyi]
MPRSYKTAPPKPNKRGRKRNPTKEEQEIAAEMERAEMEVETGEAELMEEALMNEMEPPQPSTPRRSQRIAKGTQNTQDEETATPAIFMPTPGVRVQVGTGGTPLADKPGTSKKNKAKGPAKVVVVVFYYSSFVRFNEANLLTIQYALL